LNVFVRPEVRAVVFNPAQTGTNISEKVVADIFVQVTETTQIPVALEPYGPLVKVQQVIGEGTAQILAEKIIARVLPISIEFARILIAEAVDARKQVLLEGTIPSARDRSQDTVC
jgi:hypothetical protein